MSLRRRATVVGIVQGVGFRPYLYRLAHRFGLTGTVLNSTAGVRIEVQGPARDVDAFLEALPEEAPPLARIFQLHVAEAAPVEGERGFSIRASEPTDERRALILADVATCEKCLHELFDPNDRRHRYPFINCTYCGPRYTIVRDIPYDRPLTSMASFEMCGACRREYESPSDRRFHAQPIACSDCGPRLVLHGVETEDPIRSVQDSLRSGAIVALKGIGGFHLAADARNESAVEELRRRKRRIEKPFAVMVADLEHARRFGEIDPAASEALTCVEHPIVLVPSVRGAVAPSVAPGLEQLGLFLPYSPLHHLLFDGAGFEALVMTSANLSEEPIAIGNDEALERLADIADVFLLHDREIVYRCDDSVVRPIRGRTHALRRSRGFVPVPVLLPDDAPPILAVGGELKNTVCLTRERFAFLSQHVGDLENIEAHRFFEETIAHLEHLLGVTPATIAYDMHPRYLSTQWAMAEAQRRGVRLEPVQHHHAHVAAVMAEHGLDGTVLGIALDGTGYGTDGKIWGGEILVASATDFERAAHLEYVALPGGAAAIHEPWRMALAWLHRHHGEALFDLPIDLVQKLDRRTATNVVRMIERGLNAPLTSSCGRLFDAVAALVGVRDRVTYEGQAAIELEAIATESGGSPYPFELSGDGVIGTRPLFDALLRDLSAEVPAAVMSARFHDGLAEMLAAVVRRIRDATALGRVCLSGGCFQNVRLLGTTIDRLEADGFEVFQPIAIPPNDGGLALGQAWVAACRSAGAAMGP